MPNDVSSVIRGVPRPDFKIQRKHPSTIIRERETIFGGARLLAHSREVCVEYEKDNKCSIVNMGLVRRLARLCLVAASLGTGALAVALFGVQSNDGDVASSYAVSLVFAKETTATRHWLTDFACLVSFNNRVPCTTTRLSTESTLPDHRMEVSSTPTFRTTPRLATAIALSESCSCQDHRISIVALCG